MSEHLRDQVIEQITLIRKLLEKKDLTLQIGLEHGEAFRVKGSQRTGNAFGIGEASAGYPGEGQATESVVTSIGRGRSAQPVAAGTTDEVMMTALHVRLLVTVARRRAIFATGVETKDSGEALPGRMPDL